MIGLIALSCVLIVDGNDPVILKRSYNVGDVDVFRICVSPVGQAGPLSNSFEVAFKVVAGEQVIAWGSDTPYSPSRKLARWERDGRISFTERGYDFLPNLLIANDCALRPSEVEAVRGGSITLVGVKDSVAQLRIRMPLADGTVLSENSDVEIGSRRPNHGAGTIFGYQHGQLVPIRSFTFERIRTQSISPIRQDGD